LINVHQLYSRTEERRRTKESLDKRAQLESASKKECEQQLGPVERPLRP